MLFGSPLWFLALLPWVGAALWLLWGRRKKTFVPFLELWRGPALQKPANRALQPPPIYLALALAATLLSLIAAAKPKWKTSHVTAAATVTIIVDRGMTMSAMPGAVPRFKTAAKTATQSLAPFLSQSTVVELFVLPSGGMQLASADNWIEKVDVLSPTAIDTQVSLEETVRDRLAATAGLVVIITDRPLGFDDPRLLRFSTDQRVENVGIVRLAARDMAAPQIMVRLRNDSDRKSTSLKITSADRMTSQTVDLPPRGHERDYFIDVDRLGSSVEALIDEHDDQPADDHAWLVLEGSDPKIEPRTPLSPPLQRMVDVFTKKHPPGDNATTVAIVADADPPTSTPAVLMASGATSTVQGLPSAVAHPVTANIDWAALGTDTRAIGQCPTGWTPLVAIGGRIIVAARSEPVRQVWVGFDAPNWSAQYDFVFFWANVFRWAGHSHQRYCSYPLSEFEGPWKPVAAPAISPQPAPGQWPGIYQGPLGELRAFHVPSTGAMESLPTTSNWQSRLESTLSLSRNSQQGYDLGPITIILALVSLIAALGTWKRTRCVSMIAEL